MRRVHHLPPDHRHGAIETALVHIADHPDQPHGEHDRHPLVYRARLIAAAIYQERGEWDAARRQLEANVYHDSLAPSSLEWRDSLFALAKLFYRQGTLYEAESRRAGVDHNDPATRKKGLAILEKSFNAFQDAAAKFQEMIQRYPDEPRRIEAMYWRADAERNSAKWPTKRLPLVKIQTEQGNFIEQARRHRAAAEHGYRQVIEFLNRRLESEEIGELEQLMLRNSYFARADMLFELGRYEDALAAYTSATSRYQNRPESLEAYLQIARCYRKLNRPKEAQGTLKQARVVLNNMDEDADFTATTRYNRTQWGTLLDWLTTL